MVKQHFAWWDEVVQNKIKAGAKYLTILTEFGPPNYLPALPYTCQPVANQWEINVYMKDHMPPEGKPQLTGEENALLHWWIATGASFDKKVKALQKTGEIKLALAAQQQSDVP